MGNQSYSALYFHFDEKRQVSCIWYVKKKFLFFYKFLRFSHLPQLIQPQQSRHPAFLSFQPQPSPGKHEQNECAWQQLPQLFRPPFNQHITPWNLKPPTSPLSLTFSLPQNHNSLPPIPPLPEEENSQIRFLSYIWPSSSYKPIKVYNLRNLICIYLSIHMHAHVCRYVGIPRF